MLRAMQTVGVRVESGSPEETEQAGESLAARLGPGDVVLVRGELGSGKTTFVRGACRALGVSGRHQPHLHDRPGVRGSRRGGSSRPYRLRSLTGEDPALLDDYVTGDRVAFLEWPEAAEPELGEVRARVTIAHAGGDRRVLEIE